MSQDPFDVARFEVEAAVKKVQFMHKEWKRLLNDTTDTETQQFKDLHNEIMGEIQMLNYDLQEISRSIQTVETHRDKFKLSDFDISSRKEFVQSCRHVQNEVESDMKSQETAVKIEAKQRQALLGNRANEDQQRRTGPGGSGGGSSSSTAPAYTGGSAGAAASSSSNYLEQEQMMQRQLLGEQDDELAELSKATMRIGQVAQTINGELKTQEKILQELNEDIDEQTNRMGILMKGVSGVLKTNNRWQTYALLLMVLTFLVEVTLIFST
eukprot:CAMPEP_0206519202 /NCGR_PEP_ID=MMETSP0324_2-20121206/65042_1 /ASSEMBLY_ACC=CAM_ASM_000836 /TAXON_ID=2866 /ORGANISM="Crypthecodinium cohnii, Strain Seligo" /LENGTH=267 /DNA_ID=CAMNT_0054012721 /DNA_START=134 /DNA_END=937 /DNA_ORIENTATION=+